MSEREAARIGDAVLSWLVKYDLADAGNEYRAEDVVAILNDLAPYEEAAEITRLQKELETAREALEPFARVADSYEPDEGDDACVAWAHDFTIGSLRRARDARRTTKGGGE